MAIDNVVSKFILAFLAQYSKDHCPKYSWGRNNFLRN